jgi:hypothetical protein
MGLAEGATARWLREAEVDDCSGQGRAGWLRQESYAEERMDP